MPIWNVVVFPTINDDIMVITIAIAIATVISVTSTSPGKYQHAYAARRNYM